MVAPLKKVLSSLYCFIITIQQSQMPDWLSAYGQSKSAHGWRQCTENQTHSPEIRYEQYGSGSSHRRLRI